MKKALGISAIVVSLALAGAGTASAQFGGALRKLGKKAADKATEQKPEAPPEQAKPAEPAPNEPAASAKPAAPEAPATTTADGQPNYKAYQNYDFVPGDKIVFDDDFAADADGEFPAHWKLEKGQGVVNKVNGAPAFSLTEGNYARVTPRVSVPSYLSDPFTIEFDFYPMAGGYDHVIAFLKQGDKESEVSFGDEVSTGYFDEDGANQSARYPSSGGDFPDRWHHAALVFKNGQIKAYEDQFRVLVIPDVGKFRPESVSFGGIGDPDKPIVFRNVRIANGGGMTLIDKLTKEGRIVSHGILFDVNKSVVKPESMGTIQQIVSAMKSDPALKLEIDGHTDGDGDAAKNLTLSEARANAVKQVIVDQGVDAARLTAKGYGATKPIDSNSTPEGKANNRRVEFVKQ